MSRAVRQHPLASSLTLSTEGDRVSLRAGRSRFTVSSFAATEFSPVDEINAPQTLTIAREAPFRRKS